MVIVVFFFGLIIGSFLNVVVYRLPRQKSIISPGSHCPFCEHPLSFGDMMPVLSYCLKRGKCSYCGHILPWAYPVVEGMTAITFSLVFIHTGFSIESAAGLLLSAVLIIAAFTDGQTGIIPDRLTYPAAIVSLLLVPFTVGFKSGLLGMVFLSGLFCLAAFFSKGGMGGGDVKLALSIGLLCGWPIAWWAFFLSTIMAAVYGVILLLTGQADRKTAIKFGPFLAAGSWLAWVYSGYWFSNWLGVFGL